MRPIKVFFREGGPFALVETLEDAARLLKLGGTNAVELPFVGKTTLDESEAIHKFWLEINRNATKFLTHLLNHSEGITGEKFAEEIKLVSEKFGGILGGASKLAKKYDLDFRKIVVSELRTEGTQRYRWLCPGPLLLKYKGDFKPGVVRVVAAKQNFGGGVAQSG
ncbi:MAG: hypothetical protein ABSF92_01900 [Candidatus Acidiferrales bacterium]